MEVSSSADSVVPANFSVPSSSSSNKLESRLHTPPTEALSSSLHFWSASLALPVDGFFSPQLLALRSSLTLRVFSHRSLF